MQMAPVIQKTFDFVFLSHTFLYMWMWDSGCNEMCKFTIENATSKIQKNDKKHRLYQKLVDKIHIWRLANPNTGHLSIDVKEQ